MAAQTPASQSPASAADPPFDDAPEQLLGGLIGWRESPEHVRLFAPAAHRSQYRAFVSARGLDDVLPQVAEVNPVPPGAWEPEALGPVDAFGRSGGYNRFALSRLYVMGPARVARGPHPAAQQLDAWTLISPYPDVTLSRQEPGTLLLVLRVPRL